MTLLENNDVLILNKPRGALVHGRGSLNNQVLAYLEPGLPSSLSFTPGPVHRIDRSTSGILIFGKTLKATRLLTRFFKEGLVAKFYIALLDGRLERPVTWKDRLRRNYRTKTTMVGGRIGREAVTDVWPIVADEISLVVMQLHTGITHQIRSQASFHGFPLTGDTKYRGSTLIPGYLLHAGCVHLDEDHGLGFTTVLAPPPTDLVMSVTTLLGEDALPKAETLIRERILETNR
jgi:23S rRNA pseudouridine955/2504/2580 synthase